MSNDNFSNLKKKDYYPSGSGEMSLMYFEFSAKGAAKAINGIALFFIKNGIGHAFCSKKGVEKIKNEMASTDTEELQGEYEDWLKKMSKYDEFLFRVASGKEIDWRTSWNKINVISFNAWIEGYKAEIFDNYSDEIQEKVKLALESIGLSGQPIDELTRPARATAIEKAQIDLSRVKRGEMSKAEYLCEYWYIQGSWSGGKILGEKELEKELKNEIIDFDYSKIKNIQDKVGKKINQEIAKLLSIVRISALWRESRKKYIQKYTLALDKICEQASQELGVSREIIEWTKFCEIDDVSKMQNKIKERSARCVLQCDPTGKKMDIKISRVSNLMSEFVETRETSEFKGSVACRGSIRGIARVVMKRDEFDDFQDGEILVSPMTRPEYLPIMKRAGAIITDDGGLTCHAAVVSRELNIPCIIGTKMASRVIRTGQKLEVDAENGIVKIIK